MILRFLCFFFFSSRRRHTRYWRDWSSDVCSSDLRRRDLRDVPRRVNAEPASRRVVIVTGASRGIGAGLTAGFRNAGYAVVGTAQSMPRSDEPDLLTVEGDITQVETAQRVVAQALERFGRIDTLINNA